MRMCLTKVKASSESTMRILQNVHDGVTFNIQHTLRFHTFFFFKIVVYNHIRDWHAKALKIYI